MRTNIDIDDAVLDAAMRAGGFKTKKDAVEAGLKLLARQAHYREILRWEGKLQWDGDAAPQPGDASAPRPGDATAPARALLAKEPSAQGPGAATTRTRHARR